MTKAKKQASGSSSSTVVPFADLAQSEDHYEVARMFLAALQARSLQAPVLILLSHCVRSRLQLANDRNIDIVTDDSADERATGGLKLALLSSVREKADIGTSE